MRKFYQYDVMLESEDEDFWKTLERQVASENEEDEYASKALFILTLSANAAIYGTSSIVMFDAKNEQLVSGDISINFQELEESPWYEQ